MRYEIIDGVALVYEEDRDVPFLRQPHWPNGDAWEAGEAESWAEQVILSLADVTADLAGPSRDLHPQPRPAAEDEEDVAE
jgi:hypothetical protein